MNYRCCCCFPLSTTGKVVESPVLVVAAVAVAAVSQVKEMKSGTAEKWTGVVGRIIRYVPEGRKS